MKVHDLPSGLLSHLVARAGSMSALPSLVLTRPSKICFNTRNVSPSLANAGSNNFGSPAAPNTSVSLLLVWPLAELPPPLFRSLFAQPEIATDRAATAARITVLRAFLPCMWAPLVSGSPTTLAAAGAIGDTVAPP